MVGSTVDPWDICLAVRTPPPANPACARLWLELLKNFQSFRLFIGAAPFSSSPYRGDWTGYGRKSAAPAMRANNTAAEASRPAFSFLRGMLLLYGRDGPHYANSCNLLLTLALIA